MRISGVEETLFYLAKFSHLQLPQIRISSVA
jgi:hypothetical protein